MPRIREYTNTQGIDAGPTAAAASNAATAGFYQGQNIERGANALGRSVEEIGQHIAQTETSKLAADFATAQAELTTQWNEVAKSADPNDHEVANRFMNDVVRPRLDQMGDGLQTQQAQDMYQKASAGLHADMFSKTSADQSQLAGVAAVGSLLTIKNQLSNSLRTDPSGFKNAIALSNLAVEGYVQTQHLPRDKAIELERSLNEEFARSTFIGMADANPQAAKLALANGEFADYFDGTTAKTMAEYADTQEKAAVTAQKAAETEQRKQEKLEFGAVQAKIMASTINPDTGEVTVTPDTIKAAAQSMTMPGAAQDPGAARALLGSLRAIVHDQERGTPAVTDPNVYTDFRNRAFLSDDDPNKLTTREVDQARLDHKLSDKDYAAVRGAVTHAAIDPVKREQRRKDQQIISGFKTSITHSTMFKTFGEQDQLYAQFQRDAGEVADRMHDSGKSPAEIEQTIRHMVPKYQVTGKQGLQFIQNQAKGGTPQVMAPVNGADAWKPGESAADYLKRRGK